MLGVHSLSQEVIQDVKELGKGKIGFQPTSRKDYLDFGRFYVSKVLLAAIVLGILLLAAILIRVVYPQVVSAFFTRDLQIDSSLIAGYNGKVRLYTDGGTLLFQGALEDGRINGNGTLYDTCGNLVYTGNFEQEQYSGTGELYYSDGVLCYQGEFAENLYQGQGSLYYRSGALRYEGEFAAGLFEGEGTLYTQNGSLAYTGEFKAGQYSGTGELYHDGVLAYRGQFLEGKREEKGWNTVRMVRCVIPAHFPLMFSLPAAAEKKIIPTAPSNTAEGWPMVCMREKEPFITRTARCFTPANFPVAFIRGAAC